MTDSSLLDWLYRFSVLYSVVVVGATWLQVVFHRLYPEEHFHIFLNDLSSIIGLSLYFFLLGFIYWRKKRANQTSIFQKVVTDMKTGLVVGGGVGLVVGWVNFAHPKGSWPVVTTFAMFMTFYVLLMLVLTLRVELDASNKDNKETNRNTPWR